jgi:hypothetical protein
MIRICFALDSSGIAALTARAASGAAFQAMTIVSGSAASHRHGHPPAGNIRRRRSACAPLQHQRCRSGQRMASPTVTLLRGTEGSNPSPSTGESGANLTQNPSATTPRSELSRKPDLLSSPARNSRTQLVIPLEGVVSAPSPPIPPAFAIALARVAGQAPTTPIRRRIPAVGSTAAKIDVT